jgi:Thrombospondin type 1 domain
MSSGNSQNSSSVVEQKFSFLNEKNIKIGLIIFFTVVIVVVVVVLVVNNQQTSKANNTEEIKPVDCVVNWSDWSECSSSGVQTKNGVITTQESNGGNPCPSSLTQQQACTPPPIWSKFAIGQAINCYDGDPQGLNIGGANGGGSNIYRYTGNNTIDSYPSEKVALSWDSNWMYPNTIDCTGLIQGPDMKYNPESIIQYDTTTDMAVALAPAGLYYYLPAFAYATSNLGPGNMAQNIVYSRSIDLDSDRNLRINLQGYYEVTVVGQTNNNNGSLVISVRLGETELGSTITAGQNNAQNCITLMFKVTDTPVSLVVNMKSSSVDNSRNCWTSVKWISQISNSAVINTTTSAGLISEGPVPDSAVVSSTSGLYYYLPAFAYATSNLGPGNMKQSIVYSRGIDLDSAGNLRINVPGYYQFTVVGQMNNDSLYLFIRLYLGNTGLATTISYGQSRAQNSMTVIIQVKTTPAVLSVNMSCQDVNLYCRDNVQNHSRNCWTTVKWISQISDTDLTTILRTPDSLITPGVISNTAVVNKALYYYLPAFAYATYVYKGNSTLNDRITQSIVYSRGIDLDSDRNLRINLPGYYEVTCIGAATLPGSGNLKVNFSLGNTDLGTTFSDWNSFGQNSLTVVFRVEKTPISLVVNTNTNIGVYERFCWTTVKWISM